MTDSNEKLIELVAGMEEVIRVYTGADSFGLNAMNAVSDCKKWMPAKAA